MKKNRLKRNIVAICGPSDSGKTTLISQLLRRSDLASFTGITGGEQETRHVTPCKFPGNSDNMILDTPGLTGPKTGICNKFDRAALNLSSTIVYVREYQGLPTEVDVNVIEKLLKCSARSKDRKILICLDKGKTKLTEDAASEIFDMTAQEEQMHWLHRLQELLSNRMSSLGQQAVKSCLISVEFAELNGDKKFEDKFNKDPRKAGIWTASSIGGWISDYVGPSPQEMDEE